jgi:hypothetical protein
MNRRNAMKIAAGAIAAGGAGLVALSTAFKPEKQLAQEVQNLEYNPTETNWEYFHLDPYATAQLAYNKYSEGSCMYATVSSVVLQLAEKFGEPFTSFPLHMFKYGHGGIGGFGSVCGALNGAAALIGLLISDKSIQDKMIADIFQWYESEPMPAFKPKNAVEDSSPVKSVSNSVLCHASNTNWCKASGFGVGSAERKERCRRLTGDVAQKVSNSLNEIFTNAYVTNTHSNEAANTCVACHGNEGKIKNTSVKMSCTSCHTESVAHKAFADVHYKFMK